MSYMSSSISAHMLFFVQYAICLYHPMAYHVVVVFATARYTGSPCDMHLVIVHLYHRRVLCFFPNHHGLLVLM